ncbi:MAG: exosome complex RNA-binding protein Rrp4 [Candidatus Nezhaarchaeota archaeon]|nr:exosome complex RNA-binding protein Rrp4 [Candidatus Nezhaarchaeota archaeon]
MPIYLKDWDIAVPGELLAEGNYKVGQNVIRDGHRLYSTTVGVFRYTRGTISVVALSGPYIPKVGDLVIGEVIDIASLNYIVDIRAPHVAFLHVSEASSRQINLQEEDLRKLYDIGDMLLAKVSSFERALNPSLTCRERGLGKITRGQVLAIPPARVPRLIGRRHSMLNMIRSETGCEVVVGQNGYVWVVGKTPEDEELVMEAIKKIVEEAHVSGLTVRVMNMLRARKLKLKGATRSPEEGKEGF